MVENLLANFALLIATKPRGAKLIVSARREVRGRYDRPSFPKKAFMDVVEALERLNYVVRYAGTAHRQRTTLEPTEKLTALLGENISANQLSRIEGAETIWLSTGRKTRRRWLDYTDTEQTCAMRNEMSAINAALQGVDLTLHGKHQGPVHLVRMFRAETEEDKRFDLHGRIFGGFWHYLSRGERANIRLNGKPIVEVDFSGMFPRLAYHISGCEPPQGDLYADMELPREAAKVAMSALLFRSEPMRRLPDNLKPLLDKGWNGNRVTAALAQKHPAISWMFGKGYGLRLAFLESQVLVSSLLKLIRDGITVLPLHDGLLCEQGHEKACQIAMSEASQEVLGIRLPVAIKITAP